MRHYEWAGYDVLAITDHWVRTEERSTRKLLVIPSTELNATCGPSEDDAHVLALGVQADPEPPDSFAPLQEVVDWIRANGGLPYLAHTYWSGLRTEQWEPCEGLLGIEVWNTGCELEIGRGDSSIHWDEALERGSALQGARDRRLAPSRATTAASRGRWCARPSARRRPCSRRCARAGSTARPGPTIESVEVDGNAVVVRSSPAQSVTLVSARHRGARANAGRLGYPNGSTILERDSAGLDHGLPARETAPCPVRTCRGVRHRGMPRLDESVVDSSRVAALERLGSVEFDLLVIGGGIVGAGIAEAASAHGLQVALVDKGDFAGATSSASSKLIHGGLRYLRLGDIGLVREAHHERRVLMNVVAPHLVRRLPFLFPLYEDGPYRPWFVQTGIVVYSTLARAKLNGLVGPERAEKLVPPLRDSRLRACALYEDAWTNDGRLTLANIRAAADRGATVLNYAEVVGVDPVEVAGRRPNDPGAREGAS